MCDILQFFIRGLLETFKTVQAIATFLCLPTTFNVKALLLKIPHTLNKGNGEVKLVLTLKIPHFWLVSIELEGAIEGAR